MDKDSLREVIDGIDDNTKIVIITSKADFDALVAPNLQRSIVRRIGKWVAICLMGGVSVLNVWMTLHDHFPTYVPIAEVFITKSYAQAVEIVQQIIPTDKGLPISNDHGFENRFVDLGTGYYPLSSIPQQFNSDQYIRPSGQAYI